MRSVTGHGGHSQVGYVGDGCQSLPTKAQGVDIVQILYLLELGGCVPLTQQRQVFFLQQAGVSLACSGAGLHPGEYSGAHELHVRCL